MNEMVLNDIDLFPTDNDTHVGDGSMGEEVEDPFGFYVEGITLTLVCERYSNVRQF